MNPLLVFRTFRMIALLFVALFGGIGSAHAGQFDYSDVLLVVNDNSADSVAIGSYFKTARGIDDSHVVHISAPTTEQVSAANFTSSIRTPIENFITSNGLTTSINYIVVTKGVPIRIAETTDSVDADLALILGTYSSSILQSGSTSNPYRNVAASFSRAEYGFYLVTRLDGYTVADVTALIDRSANATTTDAGTFVLDVDPTRDNPSYRSANDRMRVADTILSGRGYPTMLDETTTYVTNQTDVAGYFSWGSNDANDLNNGIPGNTYVNGAIAETAVSTSARTFTAPPSYGQSLIADLIAEGISGVKGYVAEPYLGAVAYADVLFDRYTDGYNMAESFYAASSSLGWKDIVIGDPKMVIDKTPRSFSVSAPTNNAIETEARPSFSWNETVSYHGIAKYQLFIDGILAEDDIATTSVVPGSELSPGSHSWYVRAVDTQGNTRDTVSRTVNIIPGYTSSHTFYVDNVAGDDDNPGSEAAPWATLAKATATVQGGETVIIVRNDGVPYREMLSPSNGASESDRVTFRGADADHRPEIWGSDDVSSGWSIYSGGAAGTYQRAFSGSSPLLFFTGPEVTDLSRRESGADRTALSAGQWIWVGDTLYYRLADGESMSAFHAEASVRTYAVSGSMYRTFEDISVRYAQYGLHASTGSVLSRIDSSDCEYAMSVLSGSITSSIATDSTVGIVLYGGGNTLTDSTVSGNTDFGVSFSIQASNTVFRNNIISGNGVQFDFSFLFNVPTNFSASHNNWQGAAGPDWDTYKGTDNREGLTPSFTDESTDDYTLDPFSGNIDAGTDTGITADILGNPIYGTPDIGAYEYQPPYDMTVDEPSRSVSVRMYGDGKFRNLSAPAGSDTASLSIVSEDDDRSQWLDIAISEWSSDHKEWTETSSTMTGSTEHTVGGLDPDTYYEIEVDTVPGASITGLNCSSAGMCLSGANGEIVFSYSGGYSSHTFEMTRRPDADPLLSGGAPSGTIAAGTTSAPITLSSLDASTCRYASEAGVAYDDMTGSFSSTGGLSHEGTISGLTSGQSYVYYVKCRAPSGNVAGDYAISFSVAQDELAAEIDLDEPSARIGDSRSFSVEETVYLNGRKLDLSATMPEIAGGTVEISRNGGLYKTVRVASSGKWSADIRAKKDGKNTFRLVYKNAHGTIVSSQRKTLRIDTKKPVFTSFPSILAAPIGAEAGVTRLSWDATDDDRIARYRIFFSGRIYSRSESTFLVPEWTERGWHELLVRAIDRSGNTTERAVPVFVR